MGENNHNNKAAITQSVTLEAKDWHLLPHPSSSAEKVEVGVVEIHPNNTKIVYATRRRADQSRDLGKELIVVQAIGGRSSHSSLSEEEEEEEEEADDNS